MAQNQVIRRIIPATLTLLILGIFLSLYFFKYLPRQKDNFNRRAFLELEQIEKAVQSRNTAYSRALDIYAQRRVVNALFRSFKDLTLSKSNSTSAKLSPNGVQFIVDEPFNGNYRLAYPLSPVSGSPDSIRSMSIRLDSVIAPIVSTYKDIFDSYILVGKPDSENVNVGHILYNPDDLSLDSQVRTDSLLSKEDGFSIRNVRDVIIQGNPYKLFIYPFQLGNQSVILSGLVTTEHYSSGYTDMPLDLLIPASIIILLLLMNFPILKIFILGVYERITDLDIRLLIGSYFVAAFTGFFLFSWLFLMRIQTVDNRRNLESLSGKVQDNFFQELRLITRQLRKWDNTFITQQPLAAQQNHKDRDTTVFSGMRGARLGKADSLALDSLYRPTIYPWSDITFWIDANGKWTGTWSEKKYSNKPILLQVDDRKYYKDFINRKFLTLTDSDRTIPFTIQPTLSKLDGEYTISVVIPSGDSTHRTMLVGLSSQMASVTNTVLPCGYNFSIIDENGQVLYDSRQGRALLSNILKESDNPDAILECTRFRNQRFFNLFRLKGQKVAMLATPIKSLPYTILTYYNLSDTDSSQLHLIGLAAFFSTCVLILLIISTFINEWTGKKPSILIAPSKHFEWLRPLPHKEKYYRHLISGMLSLLGAYILSWIVIKSLPRQLEFSLFFISLALPFYVAFYYYALREKQKNPGKKFRALVTSRPLIPLLLFLTLVLAVLISFSCSDTASATSTPWLSLIVQIAFFTLIGYFISSFNRHPPVPVTPLTGPLRSAVAPCATHGKHWLKYYSAAIVTGVVLISIIPACGIFWLLSWQESSMQSNTLRVEAARRINVRRLALNERMRDYKSLLGDTSPRVSLDTSPRAQAAIDSPSHLLLKFKYGLYLLPGDTIVSNRPPSRLRPFFPLSSQYQDIHELFFPEDSDVLSSTPHPDSADDGSWRFYTDEASRVWLDYEAPTDWVDNGPLQLQAGTTASGSSLSLIGRQTGSTGALFIFLYFGAQLLSVFLAYKVTMSLATRIFMIDLFNDFACPPDETPGSLPPWLETIRTEERSNPSPELILCNGELNEKLYAQLWAPLSSLEKFVLFDLAKDGFTNYRTGGILWQLQKKHLLVFYNGHLEPVTDSFREYVLTQSNDKAIKTCMQKSRRDGTWQAFKLPLTILFTAFGLFIFFTQGALYQKLGGLLTSIISMGSQITSFFDKTSRPPTPEPEPEEKS
ncbi:MAG: cache domain-containing protein [Bacteroidetes bacterium]|nr:cache domain-containing protein [Bacteroidota bacterium]